MREKKLDAAMLEDMIDHRSGLLGISSISSDMRRLHQAESTSVDAQLAIEMFCYSVRKQIAAMIAVLGGVDLIVFTGGIGENDKEVRGAICAGLDWAGVFIEDERNDRSKPRCQVRVIASQEDEQIARHTRALALRAQ
jgi:acetate kinase